MNDRNYLIFNLRDVRYGIDTSIVKEIFLLPELIPIAEAPVDIVGILDLRGAIVPIMHLDLRLGNLMQECKIGDSIVVLDWEQLQIGLIVNKVKEVQGIDSSSIDQQIDYGRKQNINPAFIAGVTKVDEEVIILLNHEALIRQPEAVRELISETTDSNELEETAFLDPNKSRETIKIISNFYDLCCPNATPVERDIFRQRAKNLKQASTEAISDLTGQKPVAVIGLSGEYFGIDLESVREFINVRSFTPVPCCPPHIVGNMNLRGEIVTLVDIRGTLNLAASPIEKGAKAVVINVDDIVAGLPVDEVLDVTYLDPQNLKKVPIAADSGSSSYLEGTVSYADKTISLIDLAKLLNKGGLIVDEEA